MNYHRGPDPAEALVASIRAAGGKAAAFGADVTAPDDVAALVAAVSEQLGPIDVLVLNATGPQPERALEDTTWEHHAAHLDFFVKSPVLLGPAVLPGMRARGWGRIVHIGSEVAARPPAAQSAYVAAKGAQLALARAWALELAPLGITVNTVAPGWIPVERHADAPDAARDAYLATVPAGQFGVPADVAAAVSASRPPTMRATSPASCSTSTAAGSPASALRDPAARGALAALRLPARDRRRAEVVGGAEGPRPPIRARSASPSQVEDHALAHAGFEGPRAGSAGA